MSKTVLPGQTFTVGAGQTSSGIIVDSGGTLNVASGGAVISTIDSGLVNVFSSGKAVGTTVASGGTEFVSAHGGARRAWRRAPARRMWPSRAR
jgi:autotransporter passenger strand-loop-strand repeat protein